METNPRKSFKVGRIRAAAQFPELDILKETSIIKMHPYHSEERDKNIFLLISSGFVAICQRTFESQVLLLINKKNKTPIFGIRGAEETKSMQDVLIYIPPSTEVGTIRDNQAYFTNKELTFEFDAQIVHGVPHAVRYKVLTAYDNKLVANIYLNYGLVTFQFNKIRSRLKALIISHGIHQALTTHNTAIMGMDFLLPKPSFYRTVTCLPPPNAVCPTSCSEKNNFRIFQSKYRSFQKVRLRGVIQLRNKREYVFAMMDAHKHNWVTLYVTCSETRDNMEFTDSKGVYQFNATGLVSRDLDTNVMRRTAKFGTIQRVNNCTTIIRNELRSSKYFGKDLYGLKRAQSFRITDENNNIIGCVGSEQFTTIIDVKQYLPPEIKILILAYGVKMAYKVLRLQSLPTPSIDSFTPHPMHLYCSKLVPTVGLVDILLGLYGHLESVIIRPAAVSKPTGCKYFDLLDLNMTCVTSLLFTEGPHGLGDAIARDTYGIPCFCINSMLMNERVYVTTLQHDLVGYFSHNVVHSNSNFPLMTMQQTNEKKHPGKIHKLFSISPHGDKVKVASIFPYRSTLRIEMKLELDPIWKALIVSVAMKLFFTSYTLNEIPVPLINSDYSVFRGGMFHPKDKLNKFCS